jgi:hypothetical protein
VILPNTQNENWIAELQSKTNGFTINRDFSYIIISSSKIEEIERESSLLADSIFMQIYESRSHDSAVGIYLRNENNWKLWEVFTRDEKHFLAGVDISVIQKDSILANFRALGVVPSDAYNIHAMQCGSGELLNYFLLEKADSNWVKLMKEKEIEHESYLKSDFVNWFSRNASGELGSFRMKNLGDENFYFLGISNSNDLKWFTDSTQEFIRPFTLGNKFGYLDFGKSLSYYGFISDSVLFFSANKVGLQGLSDCMKNTSPLNSNELFKALPPGGQVKINDIELSFASTLGLNNLWLHGTSSNKIAHWIQVGVKKISSVDISTETTAAELPIQPLTNSKRIQVVNFLTQQNNDVEITGNKLNWIENGQLKFTFECKSEIRDALQVDPLGNGQLNLLILTAGGIDMVDIQGKRVNGFPVPISGGTSGIWGVYKANKGNEGRILVASNSNQIQNIQLNGTKAVGWQIPSFNSRIESIEFASDGGTDIYVFKLEGGIVSKHKRTGGKIQ